MEWILIIGVFAYFLFFRGKSPAPKKPKIDKQKIGDAVREHPEHPRVMRSWTPVESPCNTEGNVLVAAKWYRSGEPVTVAGVGIAGGLIYVGTSLPSQRGNWDVENCLINPKLSIAGSPSGPSGYRMPYWPSYSTLPPHARRKHLEWLASDRCDTNIEIGHVFLYFYGLERRLIFEQAHGEAQEIAEELRRLLAIYGQDYSFTRYARPLLSIATLLQAGGPEFIAPSVELIRAYEIPLEVRRQLGLRLAAKEPLNADDALIWLLPMPDTYTRTAASRCFQELTALWRIRFAERFPEGLKVRTPSTKIKEYYHSASGSFNATLSFGDLPDISSIAAPIGQLRALLDECQTALDPLSRFLGREPDKRDSLAAAMALPAELQRKIASGPFAKSREAFEQLLRSSEPVIATFVEIAPLLDIDLPQGEKLSAQTVRQFASMLDLFDVGFEPDRRYGPAQQLSTTGALTLFRAAGGGKIDAAKADVVAARTLVEIAALAAVADGVVVPVELVSIQQDLAAISTLTELERQRLTACAMALLEDPPKRKAAIDRLLELSEEDRCRVTRSAISAVLADGQITPTEVRYLEHLHDALGLPKAEVYSALHRLGVPDEPVSIAPERRTSGVPIPKEVVAPVVMLDEIRLARVRRETSEVSAMLASIFTVEEASAAVQPVQPIDSKIAGLDPAHADLLMLICREGALARSVLENRARELKLLPDGAIETINEWSFDMFEEPLLEDGDMVVTAEHLIHRIQTMGALA